MRHPGQEPAKTPPWRPTFKSGSAPGWVAPWLGLAGLVALALAPSAARGHGDGPDFPERRAQAVRAVVSPVIDGLAADDVWSEAPIQGEFVQMSPKDGTEPSFQTRFQVAFDDGNLYVLIQMDDSEPEGILDRIHRRDQSSNTDWTGVALDGYHDHRSARYFFVNAGNVQRDGTISGDNRFDNAWDGVWWSAVARTPTGWNAELRIPLNAIRFNEDEGGDWGLEILRYVGRLGEESYWARIGLTDARYVSRFGHLEGVETEDAPLRLAISPYASVTGQTNLAPQTPADTDVLYRAGLDVRYGVTPQITLDATVNPDFGTVEVDQAQINLSAFEVFYPEKRPFFLEGSDIFEMTGDDTFFYTRRIGIRQPLAAAAKVTGRTTSGLGVGIVEGVTREEVRTFIAEDGTAEDVVVVPTSNYAVARIRQDVGGRSYVGGIVTAVSRPGSEYTDGYTAAIDTWLTDDDSRYRVSGTVGGSARVTEGEAVRGSTARMALAKDSGEHFVSEMSYGYNSAQLNLNDMGFQQKPNQHQGYWWLQLRELGGVGPLNQLRFNHTFWGGGMVDRPLRTHGGFDSNINGQFKNFSGFGVGVGYGIGGYDPFEARAGYDRLFLRVPEWWAWAEYQTDTRKNVVFGISSTYGYDFFTGEALRVGPGMELRLGRRGELELGAWARYATREVGFVENIDDPRTTGGDPFELTIMGRRDTVQGEIYHRGMFTFTPLLSLQYFTQFLLLQGEFTEYFALLPDGTLGPVAFNYAPGEGALDLNYGLFQANARLRYEFRPGSTVFLVWTQSRFVGGEPGVSVADAFGETFRYGSANALALKVTYRWGAEDRGRSFKIVEFFRTRGDDTKEARAKAEIGAEACLPAPGRI